MFVLFINSIQSTKFVSVIQKGTNFVAAACWAFAVVVVAYQNRSFPAFAFLAYGTGSFDFQHFGFPSGFVACTKNCNMIK